MVKTALISSCCWRLLVLQSKVLMCVYAQLMLHSLKSSYIVWATNHKQYCLRFLAVSEHNKVMQTGCSKYLFCVSYVQQHVCKSAVVFFVITSSLISYSWVIFI